MRFRYILPLLFAACLGPAPSAMASEGLLELLSIMRDSGSINEVQYKQLADTVDDDMDALDRADDSQLHIETAGGLELSTYDGEFYFELGGRLMVDMVRYDESRNKLGDGTELRRARIEMEGGLYADWGYEFAVDFADKDADIKDAYVSYRGFDPLRIKVGQFKEPFSLEELTSSRYSSFLERGLPNEFAPGRHIGVGVWRHWDSWTLTGGLFGEAFDDDAESEGNEGRSLTSRVTYSPWHEDRRALHLGGALSRQWTDDENTVKYSARPESHITDVKYLNTGKITDTRSVDLLGLEAAWVSGPWSLQGEYITARLNRAGGSSSPDFKGWTIFGSWFLTGESRHYKFNKGSFGRVKPTGRNGAWELAVRYSNMDLDDAGITGGQQRNATLGVNWYVHPQVRLMSNFIWVDNNANADDDGGVLGDDDPNILQTRIQVDF